MPDPATPTAGPGRPTLPTCPDCGGILEPTAPPWQALMDSLPSGRADRPQGEAARWQCLICGYRRP